MLKMTYCTFNCDNNNNNLLSVAVNNK